MTTVIASAAMRRLVSVAGKVGRTNSAILITGESGTGKELIARAVHHYSARAGKPFIDVNCAALPEHLMESELFGYERGAFSGAESMKPGLFETAHTGTLFLDEIGELDSRMQAKLLRVLDGQAYFRLGRLAQDSDGRAHRGGDESRVSTKRFGAASSGAICFTVSMHFICTCRLCGSGWKTSRRWPRGFCARRR